MLTALSRTREAISSLSQVSALLLADPRRFRTWSVLSSSTHAQRTQTIVLLLENGSHPQEPTRTSLVAIDHDGANILDRRVLLSELEGAVPHRYGSLEYRTAQLWLIHINAGLADGQASQAAIRVLGPAAAPLVQRIQQDLANDPLFREKLLSDW